MLCFYVWTELKGNKGLMTQETWSLPTFAMYELVIMRWNNNTNRDKISITYTAVNGTNTPAEAQSTNTDPTLWINISTGKRIFFKRDFDGQTACEPAECEISLRFAQLLRYFGPDQSFAVTDWLTYAAIPRGTTGSPATFLLKILDPLSPDGCDLFPVRMAIIAVD